jgi:hypothetical protein
MQVDSEKFQNKNGTPNFDEACGDIINQGKIRPPQTKKKTVFFVAARRKA